MQTNDLEYWTMEDCSDAKQCEETNNLLYEISKSLNDVKNLRKPPTIQTESNLTQQSLLNSFIDFLDKHKVLFAGIAIAKILLISSILGLYKYHRIIESRVKSNNHSLKVTESRAKVKSNQRKKHTESRAKSNRRNKHSLKSSRKSSRRRTIMRTNIH
jgi:hypothetical protein